MTERRDTESGASPAGGGDRIADGASDAGGADSRGADVLPLRARRSCPICGKESTRAAYPFCSTRCANIDLHRWLSDGYVIAGAESEDADDGEAGGNPGSGPASR